MLKKRQELLDFYHSKSNGKMATRYLLVVLILFTSCSYRFIKYFSLEKKLNSGEINSRMYDSIADKFYTFKMNEFRYDSVIQTKGAYVEKYIYNSDDDFSLNTSIRVLKFAPNGKVILTHHEGFINNDVLSKTVGSESRFKVFNNELIREYLLKRDFNLYNIIVYAKIRNDSLLFYKSRYANKKEYSSMDVAIFIYDSTLISDPKVVSGMK